MIWPAGNGIIAQSDGDEAMPAWMGISWNRDGTLGMVVAQGGRTWEWTFTDDDADALLEAIRNDPHQPVQSMDP